jgi:hypothetical protein
MPYKRYGRAVTQAVSRWLPTAVSRVSALAACDVLWWRKWHWGRFSPSTSVSSANHHSTNFSIVIVIRGWQNKAYWWPQCRVDRIGQHPPAYQFKKLIKCFINDVWRLFVD